MDSEVKEFLDYLHEVSHKVLKLPRKFVKSFEDIDSDSEMTDVDIKFSEWINNNNFFNSNKNMGKTKKLYLVWQTSGSFADSTYRDRLCGVFDNEEMAIALKAELDLNVVKYEDCWNIVPKDIWESWPTVDCEDNERQFEYVMEYEGYTYEQRDEQESRWLLMTKEYSEAAIEVVNMNEAL